MAWQSKPGFSRNLLFYLNLLIPYFMFIRTQIKAFKETNRKYFLLSRIYLPKKVEIAVILSGHNLTEVVNCQLSYCRSALSSWGEQNVTALKYPFCPLSVS